MIPVRRRCCSDSLVPEGWSRSADSYRRAAGKAGSVASNPTHPAAKRQAERFARRRAEDERWARELMR